MTVRAYLRIFRERWRVITLITLLAVGIAVLLTVATTKRYVATAQVYVNSNTSSDPIAQYQAQAFAQAQVATYAQIIDSDDIIHAVKNDLNLQITDSELRSELSASAPTSTTLVLVSVTNTDPNEAAKIANSAARAFVTTIQNYSKPTNSKQPAVLLRVTQPATAPSSPYTPNAPVNIVLGVFVGLLVGAALAVTLELLDNRVKTVERLSELTDAPAMGVVTQDTLAQKFPIASRSGPRNLRAENFRQLRANLQFANVDQHPRSIAITSSVPSEGKTMVAINLASTLTEAGFSVCLMDTDLRRPSVAKTLGLPGAVGLTSVLIQQVTLTEALQTVGPNFHVLTSGPTPPNPSEILASSYVREIVRSLLEMVDYVILDSAPLLPVADGAEIAALAEGTLLIARDKVTTDTQVKRSITTLSRVSARLIGVVLNGIDPKRGGEYDYSYVYARQSGRTDSDPRPGQAPLSVGTRKDDSAQAPNNEEM